MIMIPVRVSPSFSRFPYLSRNTIKNIAKNVPNIIVVVIVVHIRIGIRLLWVVIRLVNRSVVRVRLLINE